MGRVGMVGIMSGRGLRGSSFFFFFFFSGPVCLVVLLDVDHMVDILLR